MELIVKTCSASNSMKTLVACILVVFCLSVPMWADLTEGFNNITTWAGSGWVQTNNSSPLGLTNWFQGNTGIFTSHSGTADSYIAANFDNAAFGGDISNWLLTPTLSLNNGDSISFWTRTETGAPFPDSLELRLSTNGANSNVGATATSVGDFTTILLTINPGLMGSYPDSWTHFTVMVSGLGGPTSGRYGFRYVVPDTSANGDYIGIDDVNVTQVPEPASMTLLISGLAGAALWRRKNRPS